VKTPKPMQAKLRDMLIKTTQNAEFRSGFDRQMTEVVTSKSPEEFRTFVEGEIKAMGPVVKSAGLQPY